METKMLETRLIGVAEILKEDEDNKKYPTGMHGIRENFSPTNDFLLQDVEEVDSFKASISKEVSNLTSEIKQTLNDQTINMKNFLNPWENTKYKKAWTNAKDSHF